MATNKSQALNENMNVQEPQVATQEVEVTNP